ncbi:MAG: hypothetical protein LQ350_007944 [Teloschistes chrysophthalmus]|nr:MAG: hypothetical protein LQ350_007944 [Niorma chrysophthalma]
MPSNSSTTQIILVSLLQNQHPSRLAQLTPSDIQGFFAHWYPDHDLWTWIADRFSVEDIELAWQKQMWQESSLPNDVMRHIVKEQKQKQSRKEIMIRKGGPAAWEQSEKSRREYRESDIEHLVSDVNERLDPERKRRR